MQPLHRHAVKLSSDELRFVHALAQMRTANPRTHELHVRGLRAGLAVAKTLDQHLIIPCPPSSTAIDLYHHGWALKVKSVSVTVRDPQLWFRKKGPYDWDGAVLVSHHPESDDTVWISGWLGRSDWERQAREVTMYSKQMWAVDEADLQPIAHLQRARVRWESL